MRTRVWFGGEGVEEAGDAFLFSFVGLAKVAPDFLKAGGEFVVFKGEDLAGGEGGEVGAGDGPVIDFGEESPGPGELVEFHLLRFPLIAEAC